MLFEFKIFSLLFILICTVAGGWLPLTRPEVARQVDGFPIGKPFACGVFLALSLVMMLPSGVFLFKKAFPNAVLPYASVIAGSVFLLLLFMEHREEELTAKGVRPKDRTSPLIPIIMTIMIVIPSFLLGTALGVSDLVPAFVMFLAIIAHKGTAGFALAVKMVRSSMSRGQIYGLYAFFACSTPIGIVVGQEVRQYMSVPEMVMIKGGILSAAAGVFLYMATLHDLRNTPMITFCRYHSGFIAMVVGFALTVGVRFVIGEAHRF